MRYSFKSKVRYSETGSDGKLSIPSVINYFQDCSTFQSEELNVGVEYLRKEKKAWLLNSWQVEFLEIPKLGDDIEVFTWAYGFAGMYGYRNFAIDGEDGRRIINANSIWVFTDVETGKPLKVQPKDVEFYGEEEAIGMTDYGRKIVISGQGEEMASFPVRKYHIDTYGHVNNGKYVEMAMEYALPDKNIKALRVEYRKAAVYGDVICPVRYEEDDTVTISFNDEGGASYAKIQFIY